MKLGQAFKMAFKSILGNKGRSILTMLGIIIGIASVMTIVSVVNGQNKKTMEYYESMGTNKVTVNAYSWSGKDVFQELYNYCLSLDNIVLGVTPNAYASATVTYGLKNSNNMDYPPDMYFGSDQYAICNNFQIEKGRDLSFLDIQGYSQVCVMGARAARTFFDYVNPVGETIQVNGMPFTVIGVYAEKDPDSDWSLDNIIVFPYTVQRWLSPGQDMSDFVVKAKDASSTTEAITRLDGFLQGLIGDNNCWYSVYSENQWINSNNEQAMMMSLVLGGIAFISLLVGGIGIMNIMLVTVTERTREIGIRRAIGAERSSIVVQFLIEAAMICAIGGIIGIAIGFLGTFIAGSLLMQTTILPSALITIGAFSFSVILGIIFGLYPAIKASGLQPVVALRAE